MSEIRDKLRKIYNLSIQGSDGEKVAANCQLDRLLEKYGLDLSDLVDEAKEMVQFLWRNKTEERLLIQIVSKVLDSSKFNYYGNAKDCLWLNITKAEAAEIKFLFADYKREYKNQVDIFFNAFIQKNKLFANSGDGDDDKELTAEERKRIYKILQMAEGMEVVPVNRKRLTD